MSWFVRSIANSFKFDDDDDDEASADQKLEHKRPKSDGDTASPDSPTRGVKEDLSELSKTLTRQFWGVASFLEPPVQTVEKSDQDAAEPVLGIRDDFAEIGWKFKSGISRLSNNINVSEITKMASSFLQLESDEENEESVKRLSFHSSGKGAIGVTEDVVGFARDVAMHPETWLDFPLPENDRDDADFDMSDAQQEHALAVERFAPSLAALRFELCPRYMSESSFWKIYFVLLHPKLDKEDAVLLSTPQILEARALLTNELKNRKTIKSEDLPGKGSKDSEEAVSSLHDEEPLSVPSSDSENHDKTSDHNTSSSTAIAATETGNRTVDINEVQTVDKSVVAEKDVDRGNDQHVNYGNEEEEDTDDWLKEETSEVVGTMGNTIPIANEDDVSFSDLEEEDDGDIPTNYSKSNDSSGKDSRDWVQL